MNYVVITDDVYISAESSAWCDFPIGQPFPRSLTEDEIQAIYYGQNHTDGNTIGNFIRLDDAVRLANSIPCKSTLYTDGDTEYILCNTVRIEAFEVDSDGNVDSIDSDPIPYFRCTAYNYK